MIETKQAMDRIDDILSVPGLDALYVGPNDLAITLGYPPSGVPTEPGMLEAIDIIAAAAKRHNIVAGIHCGSTAMAHDMIRRGYRFTTLMNDNVLLNTAAKNCVAEMRKSDAAPARPAGLY